MKKNLIDDAVTEVRPVTLGLYSVINMNKALSFTVIAVFIITTGILGFTLGSLTSTKTPTRSIEVKSDLSLIGDVTDQEILCLEIETLDQQKRNDALREENNIIKEESDTIADTILNSLMSNLQSKELANRSNTLNSYLQEADNLIKLNAKLEDFKKTSDYGQIDISKYENALTTRLSYIPTLKPIPGVFEGFGPRIHPIYKYYHFHPAADQGAATGTPIKAAGSGYVIRASWNNSMGWNVCINHGNGFVTTYMHNNKNNVVTGQRVIKGDIIGYVGSTGTATGPHLHFSVDYNGTPFNPQKILMQ